MSGESGPPGRLVVETPDAGSKTLLYSPAGGPANLSEYLRVHGVPLNTRCGGRGLCESCMVELVRGEVRGIASGKTATANGAPVPVKACEVRLEGLEAHVRVPARSYLRYRPQIITDYRINIPCGHDPLYQDVPIEHLVPENLIADLRRRFSGTPVNITADAGRQAAMLRGEAVQAAVEHRGEARLITRVAAPGAAALGVAIDIGTTTVALILVDLTSGKVLAQAAMFNQQMNLGDDVVTRIQLCMNDSSMVAAMQKLVARQTILPLVNSALQHAGAKAEQVRCFAIAANTTMLHLVAGVDPTPMGTAPFTPAFLGHKVVASAEVFGEGFAGAAVHLLPSASAYVGADLTAGVVASGMLYDDGPSLLVDVGTNGEIILKHKEKFLGCATAAGPAFEGAGLSCGMRAGDGTIAYVRLEGRGENFQVHTQTIGHEDGKPARIVGICGSAYIDFLAEARKCGLLVPTGRFDPEFDHRGHVIDWDHHHDKAFRLGYAPGKQPVVISQRDIASLMQAKAAVAAGILTLLANAGLQPADIKTLYLAGGFGTKMVSGNAIACGLLPGFTPTQIQPVGNTALAGAYLGLLDASLLREVRRVGEEMEVIELNLDPRFEDCYIEQLSLP